LHGNAHGHELPEVASTLGLMLSSAGLIYAGRVLGHKLPMPAVKWTGAAIAATGTMLLRCLRPALPVWRYFRPASIWQRCPRRDGAPGTRWAQPFSDTDLTAGETGADLGQIGFHIARQFNVFDQTQRLGSVIDVDQAAPWLPVRDGRSRFSSKGDSRACLPA
jgi:hypothetical protein